MEIKKTKTAFGKKMLREHLFAACIVILPVAWWAFTFFYTTFDTILLAFKQYDGITQQTTWVGFDNFKSVFSDLVNDGGLLNISFRNSIMMWLINIFFSIPLALLVSFALYKKVIGQSAYKVLLFLPSIVSSMVWVIIFSTFIYQGLGKDWLSNPDTALITLIVYSLWIGFAGNMVLYTGAMSRIPPSLVEAGQLDGMNEIKEFIYIVIPLIFPTLSVILTTCVITVFTTQLPSLAFYGQKTAQEKSELYTLGFYTFIKGLNGDPTETPLVSALSIIVCLIAAPVTLLTRRVLDKLSPTAEF